MKSKKKKIPKTGDMRWRTKFLWWPMRMVTDGRKHTQWRWLERTIWLEVYEVGYGDLHWRKDRWL